MPRKIRPLQSWEQHLIQAETYEPHLGTKWAIDYLLDQLEDLNAPLDHAVALVYAELDIYLWETVSLAVPWEEPPGVACFRRAVDVHSRNKNSAPRKDNPEGSA